MELRQLRIFVAVAETGSFTGAAVRLHLVQSSVSTGLGKLERELGAQLVTRSHPVALTDAGRVLLDQARDILSAADAAAQSVGAVNGRLRGRVRLGVMPARRASSLSVASIVRAFSRAHPEVRVEIDPTGGTVGQVSAVAEGRLELATICRPRQTPPGVSMTPLTSEAMTLVCHRNHDLTRLDRSVSRDDLHGRAFVEMPAEWGATSIIEDALGDESERQVLYRVADVVSLLDFVAHGMALAVLPPSFVAPHLLLRTVPLADPPMFPTVLALPRGRPVGAVTQALAATIRSLASPTVATIEVDQDHDLRSTHQP